MKVKNIISEIETLWEEFRATSIASRFSEHLGEFKQWLFSEGIDVIMKKTVNRPSWITDYGYAKAILRRGSVKLLVNLFAAWLVINKKATTYYLLKNRYVAGAESIYTWARVLRHERR